MEYLIWKFSGILGGTIFVLGFFANWGNPISYIMGILGIFFAYWKIRDMKATAQRKEIENRKMLREEQQELNKLKKVK